MQKGVHKVEAYPEILKLLNLLHSEVQTVLGTRFQGLYIHGSLACGDFNPLRSDIDFLVVTTEKLSQAIIDELIVMHKRIKSRGLPWATKLEGSYIPQNALRRYHPSNSHHPALRVDGSFDVDHHGMGWILLRHLIVQEAIVLAGPDPEELIDPISSETLRQAAMGTLEEWWIPQIENPTRLQTTEYRAYTVLTMCRILYTLHHGSIASKSEAVEWARTKMDSHWLQLIDNAYLWPRNSGTIDVESTQSLIRYTADKTNLVG